MIVMSETPTERAIPDFVAPPATINLISFCPSVSVAADAATTGAFPFPAVGALVASAFEGGVLVIFGFAMIEFLGPDDVANNIRLVIPDVKGTASALIR